MLFSQLGQWLSDAGMHSEWRAEQALTGLLWQLLKRDPCFTVTQPVGNKRASLNTTELAKGAAVRATPATRWPGSPPAAKVKRAAAGVLQSSGSEQSMVMAQMGVQLNNMGMGAAWRAAAGLPRKLSDLLKRDLRR